MHVKKPVSPNKEAKVAFVRATYIARAVRRSFNLSRMLHNIPYFKKQTLINEFTPR